MAVRRNLYRLFYINKIETFYKHRKNIERLSFAHTVRNVLKSQGGYDNEQQGNGNEGKRA